MKISACGLQIRNLSALFAIQGSACHFVLYDLACVLWIVKKGIDWPKALGWFSRRIAGLMKYLVCALLVGLYFTSFERQWHLQVVEITEVHKLSFSEPKSFNSRNGPSLSPCEWCNNMSELEYLLHNRLHIASVRV